MKSVYLAGPDVFYPDAKLRGLQLLAVCQVHGFKGLYPLETDVGCNTQVEAIKPTPPGELSKAIYESNIRLIDSADGVVANLKDFRGFEPDSGTVWEVAYALSKGKAVVGYLPRSDSILERMEGHVVQGKDKDGCTVEDFGLPLNLMLAHSLTDVVFGAEKDFQGLNAALVKMKLLLQGPHLAP